MARKKKNIGIDPSYLEKQKASLKRSHRRSVFFNQQEMAAIDEYRRRFKVASLSALIRSSVMKHVLEGLEENHPTLF